MSDTLDHCFLIIDPIENGEWEPLELFDANFIRINRIHIGRATNCFDGPFDLVQKCCGGPWAFGKIECYRFENFIFGRRKKSDFHLPKTLARILARTSFASWDSILPRL